MEVRFIAYIKVKYMTAIGHKVEMKKTYNRNSIKYTILMFFYM